MKETLKKGFYAGLGAGLLLKDEIMDALNAPVKVTDVPIQEMREQLRQVLEKVSGGVSKEVDAAKEAGQEELDGLLDRFGLAKAGDVKALKERIEELERRLAGK